MIVGILGHAARFTIYSYFPYAVPVVLIQLLHGICYAFFFATVFIFVDEYFPKDVRASAQGLFNMMILGFGALAANSLCPQLKDWFTQNGITNFHSLFLVPLAVAVVAAIALALFFRPPPKQQPQPATETAVAA